MKRILLFALILVVLLALSAQAAITFQAAFEGDAGTGTATSETYSATVNAGTNTAIFVGYAMGCVTSCPSSPITVTFNGDALTHIADTVAGGAPVTGLHYRVSPDVATGDVVVDPSTDQRIATVAIVLDGVDQSSPIGATDDNTTGSALTITCFPESGVVLPRE